MAFGIVCEYNPFHNGHLHQIKEIKKASDEPIICVMSGNFTQRGEVAIADKYARAKMALDGGADGLTFYRRLTHFADKNLKTGGLFACEIGFDQKDSVCEIFKSAGYEPECMTDGSGMDRVVYFIKK